MKKLLSLIIIILLGALGIYLYKDGYHDKLSIIYSNYNFFNDKFIVKKQKYNDCLIKPYKDESIDRIFNELVNDYKNTGVSIYFKDIYNQYTLSLNESKIYYSASASKLFEVIYLIEQARDKKIDLNTSLTYEPKLARTGSIGMKKHKYYDEVSINELISYILMYSDNTAHLMLIDYIGLDTLKNYFSDYDLVLLESDPFVRNYTAYKASLSLDRLYNILNIDDEYSSLIKESMNNLNFNYLNFDDKIFYHKYGWYDMNFHDIGIYDNTYPYTIVILTQYGNKGEDVYGNKIREISKKIYEIYNKNLQLKEEYCQKQRDE